MTGANAPQTTEDGPVETEPAPTPETPDEVEPRRDRTESGTGEGDSR